MRQKPISPLKAKTKTEKFNKNTLLEDNPEETTEQYSKKMM